MSQGLLLKWLVWLQKKVVKNLSLVDENRSWPVTKGESLRNFGKEVCLFLGGSYVLSMCLLVTCHQTIPLNPYFLVCKKGICLGKGADLKTLLRMTYLVGKVKSNS